MFVSYLRPGALVGVVRIYILIGMLHLALSSARPGKVGNDVRGRADAGMLGRLQSGLQVCGLGGGGFPRSWHWVHICHVGRKGWESCETRCLSLLAGGNI